MTAELVRPSAPAVSDGPVTPAAPRPGAPVPSHSPESVGAIAVRLTAQYVPLVAVVALAAFLRLTALTRIGYNSDEAVYAGTGASMAGQTDLQGMFPVFRAHPLLFQGLVSLVFRDHVTEWGGRAVAAVVGVAAVLATYALANRLYGPVAATIAALLLALMPYHVVVSRQVLLDGLIVPFATLTLYCIARYAEDVGGRWMIAAGGMLGLAVLSKETAIVLAGGLYAFFATAPRVAVKLRHVLAGALALGSIVVAFPLVVRVSGKSTTGSNYFLWQLSRRPNHETWFYATTLPSAIGVAVLVVGAVGLVWLRSHGTWREPLLVWWIIVPAVFFTLWPVKGYQYLLPVAPAVAILAGRTLAYISTIKVLRKRAKRRRATVAVASLAVAWTLAGPTWAVVHPSNTGEFLAGTGGVPGGREAGLWVHDHVPPGSQLLAVGPSMANIIEFYGRRRVYGLSVSANPHARNPAYAPVPNPDRWVRDGRVQYLVWDSYSAARTPFFTQKITDLVTKYRAVAVYTATAEVNTSGGSTTSKPVVIVYQVWSA